MALAAADCSGIPSASIAWSANVSTEPLRMTRAMIGLLAAGKGSCTGGISAEGRDLEVARLDAAGPLSIRSTIDFGIVNESLPIQYWTRPSYSCTLSTIIRRPLLSTMVSAAAVAPNTAKQQNVIIVRT